MILSHSFFPSWSDELNQEDDEEVELYDEVIYGLDEGKITRLIE